MSNDFKVLENGYSFSKWIFRICSIVALLFFLFVVFLNGGLGDKVFVECPVGRGVCDNPFYMNCDLLRGNDESVIQARYLCNQSFLFEGSVIGKPQPVFFSYVNFILVGIFVVGFLVNHLLFNNKVQRLLRRKEL